MQRKNSSVYFFSVLFIPEYGRRMAFYAFRSSTCLSEVVGFWDTWRVYGPSSGRQWLARAWCWATLRRLHPRDSRKTPVLGEVLIR